MNDEQSNSAARPVSPLVAWGQLIRLPNVFTVIADVSAAFLLVAQGPQPYGRFAMVVAAGIALYWAGMVLNDIFDLEKDRQERSNRPLPSGNVPLGQAQTVGWGLLLLGVIIAACSGMMPTEIYPNTWVPAAIAILLAIMIVAYDGPLKSTPLAPATMGGCRVLSFLLGCSPCISGDLNEGPLFPVYVLVIALGFGVYVMGITTMGRNEAAGGDSMGVFRGMVMVLIGIGMLAIAPQFAEETIQWQVSQKLRDSFPMLVGVIALPVVMRSIRAAQDPTPQKIQMSIKVGVLSIIPLAAVFAYLGAGMNWMLAIFALAIPSVLLSGRFRVT